MQSSLLLSSKFFQGTQDRHLRVVKGGATKDIILFLRYFTNIFYFDFPL